MVTLANDIKDHTGIEHPLTKLAAVAAGLGISSWSDAAAALAAIYSALLIGEYAWKKFLRPVLEDLGWIAPRKRRKEDKT